MPNVPCLLPILRWRGPALPASLTLEECFCWQEERSVALDNTLSYYQQRLQVLPTQTRQSWARAKVIVYESFDGALRVFAQGQGIPSRPAPADPAQARAQEQQSALPTAVGGETRKPKATHPWRRKAIASPPS